jgi:hypothetical protein
MPAPTLRQWHSYIGLFIAPSILFFALTGALQLFNLHEAHGSYHPAALIESLSAVHKDQVLTPHEHADHDQDEGHEAPASAAKAPAPPAAQGDQHPQDEDEPGAATLALKVFFCLVATALVISTSLGIWMGLTQLRSKALAWSLLIVGALVPIALLLA